MPFGWGDGGGGPTREMVASARRFASLEGAPTVELGSPNTFFARAEAELAQPSVWTGEMYLEFHRGTYTSQARTKQGNRRSEHLLREAELWAATAAVQQGAEYPYDELERLWRTALLHQFHDILPGSSIGWVHRQAEETYAAIGAELEGLIAAAASAVVGDGDLPAAAQRRTARPVRGARPRAPVRSRSPTVTPVDPRAGRGRHGPRPQRAGRRPPHAPAGRSTRCATWWPTAR